MPMESGTYGSDPTSAPVPDYTESPPSQ
jgi:hypothetical protein